MNRKILALIAAVPAVVFTSNAALAAAHSGTITHYHLNADHAGRGPCVRMSPQLPDSKWACLWQSNQLYSETTDLLLDAYINGKNCSIHWSEKDMHNHALIRLVDCR